MGREGDWECGSCGNRNYAFRSLCNRCKQCRLVVDNQTRGDSKWLPRIGDWICNGCSNNNYASREACNKCGQAKEAAMPPLHNYYYYYHHHSSPAPPAAGEINTHPPHPPPPPNGWRSGDWICICGFHNYSSRAQCKKCNAFSSSAPPPPPPTHLLPSHGTKRLASEAVLGEWDNKRLNAGDISNHFLATQQHSYQGHEQIGRPSNDQTCFYPYFSAGSATSLNSQVHMQLQQLAPVPTLLGKGAKQWRDGDWMCTHCSNHNYASRSQCNRCKTEKDAVTQSVGVA